MHWMSSTACKVRWFSKIDKFPRHTSFHIKQGIARTQSPTNKNYAAKFPTFGEIVGVNRPAVQWNSLVLGELPPWSQLAPQPGKYACTKNTPLKTSRFPMSNALNVQVCHLCSNCCVLLFYWQSFNVVIEFCKAKNEFFILQKLSTRDSTRC